MDEAVRAFERLGFRVAAARTMVDLARTMHRLGEDAAQTLGRARSVLESCEARGFLFEADDAAADIGAGR